MSDVLLKIAVFGGPISLGLMGVFVTIYSPSPVAHKKWIVAFVAIAIFSTAAAIVESIITDRRLDALITGRNDFFYFKADLPAVIRSDGLLQLRGVTSGPNGVAASVWISPAEIKGNAQDPRYWTESPTGFLRLDIPAGGYLSGVRVPVGMWRIEFTGRNTGWVEILNLFELRGKMVQTISVEKDGVIVWDEADPLEAFKNDNSIFRNEP